MTAKSAGAKFETDVVAYLRECGADAERLAKAGKNDEGDVVYFAGNDIVVVMELKVRRDKTTGLSLGTYIEEATVEAKRYTTARSLHRDALPVAVVKRVNKGIADSFVVIRMEEFVSVMEGNY